MKRIFSFVFLALFCSVTTLSAQKAKSSLSAVYYSLPKTMVEVEVEVTKTVQETGPYFRHSERYLNIKDVITENKTSYSIGSVQINQKAVADPSKAYNMAAYDNMLISVDENGVITGINLKNVAEDNQKQEKQSEKQAEKSLFFDNMIMTEEQLTANSTTKMAELAAKQIYLLRENRIDLLTGEEEKMPADGKSLELMLEGMAKMEQSLVELFVGKKTLTTEKKTFLIDPAEGTNQVLCRISAINGLVAADDLSGAPIYIFVTPTKNKTAKINEKQKNVIYYLLPGSSKITIMRDNETLVEKDIQVAQLGSLQALPFSLFKKEKVSIQYNPTTGAIETMKK